MKLSVVVPVYNTGSFVQEFFGSFFHNNQSGELIELIFVNDGSSDNSLQILNQFKESYSNISVVNQANQGLGAARNAGMNIAKGEYIWFIDSDDRLIEGALDKVLNAIEQSRADILTVDFRCSDSSGNTINWIKCQWQPGHNVLLNADAFFLENNELTYIWCYIFRRALLENNNLRFLPRVNMQDAEFLPRVIHVSSSVFISGVLAYEYVKRPGSYINSSDELVREKYAKSVLVVYESLSHFVQRADLSPVLRLGLNRKLNILCQILFYSVLYDNFPVERKIFFLRSLKEARVYPFSFDFVLGHAPVRYLKLARFFLNRMPRIFLFIFSRRNRIVFWRGKS